MKHCGQCCLTLIQPFVPFDSPNCSLNMTFSNLEWEEGILFFNWRVDDNGGGGGEIIVGKRCKYYSSCKANFDQSCKKTFLREGINKTIANVSERYWGKYLRKKPQLALKLGH